MSDTNRVSLKWVEELSFATVPGSVTLAELRFVSESLKQATTKVASAEIRDDRQIADVKRTNIAAEGDVALELTYATFDTFLAAALQDSGWASTHTVSSSAVLEVDIAAGVTRIRDTTTAGNKFTNFTVGSWVKVTGFTNSANNGIFKVSEVDDDFIVIENDVGMVDTSGANGTVTVLQGAELVNGTSLRSFIFEKQFNDLSNEFAIYYGMCVNSMQINVSADAIVTGTLSFIGAREETASATIHDTGSVTETNTRDVMSAVEDVTAIVEAGVNMEATNLTFQIQNNLRARQIIGTLGAISVGSGSAVISGTLQLYFEDATLMDKYLGWTASSLAIVFQDTTGSYYVFDFPRVKYTSGARVASGQNADVIADMAFDAYRDPDEGISVRIVRFD